MFLKRIEIQGFKSFADKTGVDFSPGVTAVVGPNGSGKSNIADAVRWVLGEQSARSLRGSKMEDVIFAGSESRRPINFCEVSLTLDNMDHHLPVVFDEVTITRRVYRSGESEYMINKQACRLKDINELFMDSGLGRESYSIIGQGRIEEMLSTRAEDRRGPFEDAAGIVKFKARRKEAERKLEETAANLLRVDDILAELERQAGPLRQEAERATVYKDLAEQLKNRDISLLVHDIDRLQERFHSAAADVEQFALQRQQRAAEAASTDAVWQQARSKFEAQSQALDVMQKQMLDAVEDRQKTDGNLALLKERLVHAEQTIADRESQKTQVSKELEELLAQKAERETRLSVILANVELKNSELEVAAESVDPNLRAKLEAQITNLNAELIELHQQSATYRNEFKLAEESMSADERKKERLLRDIERFESDRARVQEQVAALESEQMTRKSRVESLNAELADAANSSRELARQEADCVAELHQLSSSAASLQSRADLLKELEEGYDGFALGVKTVLQAAERDRLQGVRGALVSLLNVPKAYELAIETSLGGALQNVVVSTEADARAAIQMLKSRQAGRATFMPMDVIKSRLLNQNEQNKVAHHPGFVGVASGLVECEPEYRHVVEHLLGNVIIASKLTDANELARKLDYRVRIVTLEGDVVSPGGLMSGGSHARKGPGLLGRSRERAEVEEKLNDIHNAALQKKARQAELREQMTAYQKRQSAITEQLEQVRRASAQAELSLREFQAKKQNAKDRMDALLWEQSQLEAGQSEWNNRVAKAKDALIQAETDIANIEAQLVNTRHELEERDLKYTAAQERLTGLRVELATLNQERETIYENVRDLDGRIQRLHERNHQVGEEVKTTERGIAETKQAILTAEKLLEDLVQKVSDMEVNMTSLRTARHEAEGDVAVAEQALRRAQQAVSAVEDQLHRAEVQAERTDMELNHALTKLGDTYHMTYEWAKEHYEPVVDLDSAKAEADKLRRQIAGLGDVRIGAIDEWERLSERMTFLQNERLDLEQAESQLRDVISEIDEEMSKRFLQTFEQIRSEFQVSFRNLFGGGRADLELTDETNLLTTGIEVIAQPPGKKLQNLNLMSGGERALTAMALLFAILRVRPVPFCVLDEVEAALDEANVSRFASQLRKFVTETQFIVITHRRGTMEEADVLYGVTMQESGVSSMISVRLSDELDFETA